MRDATGDIVGGEAYEELGELYDVWCAEVVEDAPFYVGLATALTAELGRDALDVVELGGGSGRIAVQLAAASHRVTAIEASPGQIMRLNERASAAGVSERATAILGDMRDIRRHVPAGSVDLVLVPFRGMLHITPDRDALFSAVLDCLRPGGVFAFDVFHPTAEQIGVTDGRWLHRREELTRGGRWRFQERATYRPELAAEPGGLKLEVAVRCRWTRSRRGRRIDALPLADPVEADSLEGDSLERQTLLELQLVPAERWADSLLAAGFTIDGAYGWFDGRPLDVDDDDSIWVARSGRPAEPAD